MRPDVAVSGAGPAGSTAAIAFAAAGKLVVLTDSSEPGGKGICGGFLGPEVNGLMQALGLEKGFESFPKTRIRKLLVSGPKTRRLESAFDGPPAWAVERPAFDRWLAASAAARGVETRWNTSISPYAAVRVRAHGRRPRALPRAKTFFACKTAFRNVDGMDGSVALHFVKQGHVGLNSLGAGKATMCLYVSGAAFAGSPGNLDGLLRGFMSENPHLKRHLAAAERESSWRACSAEPDDQTRFTDGGDWLVGDAVTMVHPIIGGGIPVAMESGLLLAAALLGGGPARYAAAWRRRFGRRVKMAAFLGRIERRPALTELVLRTVAALPGAFPPFVRFSRG